MPTDNLYLNTPYTNMGLGGIPPIGGIGMQQEQPGLLGGLGDYLGNQSLGDLTDLTGLGIGAYSTLFGGQADLFDTQKKLLEQQISSNRANIQNTADYRKALKQGSANVFGNQGGMSGISPNIKQGVQYGTKN